ncbi:VOC family protein [Clostridium sp. YIM B02551]|uniref:VOC family protein n=1 Tax=Clostridium sp. YIM B02551 TaxID=2910679 RepID=UPI001EEA436E|nr:glyoxalase/bleomycin resistance/extradiol dioxygenase family protein [Clostridium sp. YIM B02551]
MKITPRIVMKGNSKEAIEFYSEAFGATTDYLITYGSVGAGSPEQKDLIMNAQVDIKGTKIHIADHNPAQVTNGNQISFTVELSNPEEVKETFNKMKDGSKIIMEPIATFFSPCHCGLIDKFGVMWQINCPK